MPAPQQELKIIIPSTGAAKVLRFAPDMTIAEVLKETKIRTEIGGADFGLFQPPVAGKKARWLAKNRTLKFYDIMNNGELEYKKKTRKLKVKLPDDTVKTIFIDDSGTTNEIVRTVVEKLDIKTDPEEWGLRRENKPDNLFLHDTETLQEQDVLDEEEQLLFEKKLFGMENTDMSDLVVLHYSYVQVRLNQSIPDQFVNCIQAKKRIVSGKYPCQRIEIQALAGLQAHVTLGNYDPEKHKPGALKLSDYIPAQWLKAKNIERDILAEYKKFMGMTDLQAKYRYLQVVKSLKTYGITFFEVKQEHKTPKTTKLTPMYLGVNKDKIVLADFETKQHVKEWKFSQLKKWSATDKQVILDLGDWHDELLSFQTAEGEGASIAAMLNNYIDLILKARNDHMKEEVEDDSLAAHEEVLSAVEGNVSYSQTAGRTTGMVSPRSMQLSDASSGTSGLSTSAYPNSQQVAVTDLSSALKSAQALYNEMGSGLETYQSVGVLTSEQWRDQLARNQDSLMANVSNLINASRMDPSMFNRSMLDNISKQVNVELFGLAAAAKNIAKLDEDLPTLEGARAVVNAIAKMLESAERIYMAPGEAQLVAELVEAEKLLQYSITRLDEVKQARLADAGAQLLMVECLGNISMALDDIINGSEKAVSTLDAASRTPVDKEIQTFKSSRQWYIDNISTLIPVAYSQPIKSLIAGSANQLNELGSKLVTVAKGSGINNWNQAPLDNALKALNESVRNLLIAAETAERRGAAEDALDLHTTVNLMLATMNQLKGNMTDPVKLVNLVKSAVSTNNTLMTITEKLGAANDEMIRERLVKAGKNLAEAMGKLVESARKVRENPEDKLAQQHMLNTAMRIENLAQDLLADAGETAAVTALRYYSKAATAGMIKWTAIAKQTTAISDAATRSAFSKSIVEARSAMQNMLNAVRIAGQDSNGSHEALLQAALRTLPAYRDAVNQGLKVQHTVNDAKQKQDIALVTRESADLNKKLEDACRVVADIGSKDALDESMLEFETAIATLESAEFSAKQGLLVAPHSQTRETAMKELNVAIKRVETTMDSIAATAKQGGKLPEVVRNSASAISQITTAVKTMAGTVTDRTMQKRIITCAKGLVTDTQNFITSGRVLAIDMRNKEKIIELQKNHWKTKSTLGTLIASAKGLDTRECDEAMILIQNELLKLTGDEKVNTPFQQAAEGLTSVCKALIAAVSQLVAMARSNPRGLGASAKITASTMTQLIQAAHIAASSTKDQQVRNDVLLSARNLADAINGLLNSSKYAAAEGDQNSLANLADSNTETTNSIQKVIGSLGGVNAPECDEAIRLIMDAVQLLDRGDTAGVTGKGRGEVLNDVSNAVKSLAQMTSHLVSAAKVSANKLGMFAKQVANVIVDLIDTARAASKKPESEGVLSEDASIVVKCIILILQDTTDSTKVSAAAKRAAMTAAKLIATNKELAKNLPADQKVHQQNLVKAIKSVADGATRLAKAAQLAVNQTTESIEELILAANELKEKTIQLEDVAGTGQDLSSVASVDPQNVKQLSSSSKTVAVSTAELIRASAFVSVKNSPGASEDLTRAVSSVNDAIQGLAAVATALNPSVRECQKAVDVLNNVMAEFDAANIALTVGKLQIALPANKTQQDVQNDMAHVMKDLSADVQNVSQAAITGNSGQLVAAVKNIQNRVPIMMRISKAVASTYPNIQQQKELVAVSKEATEAILNLVKAADPSEKRPAEVIKKCTEGASQAIAKLLNSLQTSATVISDIDNILNNLKQLTAEIIAPLAQKPAENYQTHRRELATLAHELAAGISNLNKVNKSNIGEVGLAANVIGDKAPKLTEAVCKAAATTSDQAAGQAIRSAGKKLLDCSGMILNSTKRLAQNPNDGREQNLIKNAFNAANGAVGELMTAVKNGAVGEMMFDKAIEDINNATGNLNTMSIFAQASQLEVPKEVLSTTMQALETSLLNETKKILSLTGGLDQAAQMTEEELGKLAKEIAACVTSASNDAVKTASRVPDSTSQQDILNCAKAVAIATHQILLSAKDVQRSPNDRTSLGTLNDSQNGVSDAVNQLINTVKSASEEFARGELELENAIKAIEKFIQHTPGQPGAKPEDVIAALRMITDSTANVVFASNQEDLVKAAKEASAGVSKMMNAARGAAQLSTDQAVRNGVASSSRETARSMVKLLEAGKLNRQDPATQGKLEEASGAVTNAIQGVVNALRALPNAKDLSLEENSQLEALAESELLNAARVIAEAAKTLMNAKPRRTKPKVEGVVDEEDIVEAIIDAARAITSATGNLVQAATTAQKERKTALNTGAALNKYRNDPTWANGLISAAKNVAGGVKMLVQASTAAAQGKTEEQQLVAAARAVGAATTHLVTASRVKADSNSKAQQSLTGAAKAVTSATNELVKAAQHAANFEKEDDVALGAGYMGATQEINQQTEILRLERDLQRARQGLSKIRNAQNNNK